MESSETKPVIDAIERLSKAETGRIDPVRPETGAYIVVPEGKKVVDLRPYIEPELVRPKRREGSAAFTRLESLIEHANRFRDEHSAIFVSDDETNPSIIVVLDYHEREAHGLPRFGKHRGIYRFPVSSEWRFWTDGKGLDGLGQDAFAGLIEDHIGEVLEPGELSDATRELCASIGIEPIAGAGALKTLARGLRVHVEHRVANHVDRNTGESNLVFTEAHTDESGAPLRVPNGFVVGVPVLRGGPLYALPVRLRYRVSGGRVIWSIACHRADKAFAETVEEAAERVREGTGLPLFFGHPEP